MDPLSVAASVVGLLGVTGKITKVLAHITGSLADAPALCKSTLVELGDLSGALRQLNTFSHGRWPSQPSSASTCCLSTLLLR